MKKLYFIALMLLAFNARAQYFQHIYGTSNDDVLTSGINTRVNPQGQFMAGENQHPCLPGIFGIPAAYSDVNGNIPGPPFFQNDYFIINANGTYMMPEDAQVFEMDNGAGFGIVGKYTDPTAPAPNTGVYYLQLNPNGVPVATFMYNPAGGGGYAFFDVLDVGGIAESAFSGGADLYVTGSVKANNGDILPFAMKLNVATGAQLWSQVYLIQQNPFGDAWGRDIAENPMAPFGQQWAEFVGEVINTQQGVSSDGYLQHVDMNTGLPVHPTIFYGQPTTQDHWNSINVCAGGAPGPFPPGFVLGGGTDAQGSMDYWILRMDPLIAHFWSNSYDYSAAGLQYDDCFDVIERLNTTPQYEYYATGYTDNGSIGGFDVVDVKVDFAGVAVAEFTYGSAGNDFGEALDQFNGTPADGLTTFGTWDGGGLGGNRDMYLVKSYFNGISGCNEAFNTPTDLPEIGPGLHIPSVNIANFNSGNFSQNFLPITDATLCFALNVFGGNNARVANPNTGTEAGNRHASDAVVLMPNPAESGTKNVSLKINSDFAGDATITVYDMIGKAYYTGKFTLVKGSNVLPLDMGKATLSAGSYNVVIYNGEKVQNTIMLVK